MNKAIVGVALSVAVISLVGCGNKEATMDNNAQNTDTENTANNTAPAKVGDAVKVDYVGTLEDGSMFDTSVAAKAQEGGIFDETRPYEPLTVNLGKGEVIPGFENALVGMNVGDTKKITLTAEEAYGQPRPELIQKVPVETFSWSNIEPEVGKTYNFGIAQGTIKEVSATEITIDFNHPLAGKTLIFDLTVTDIMADAANVAAPAGEPTMPTEEPTAEDAPVADAAAPTAETGAAAQ